MRPSGGSLQGVVWIGGFQRILLTAGVSETTIIRDAPWACRWDCPAGCPCNWIDLRGNRSEDLSEGQP